MQCEYLDDNRILRFLDRHGGIGCTVWTHDVKVFDEETRKVKIEKQPINERSVARLFPIGTSEKLLRAKMMALVRRGLVDGCGCGCRGDWELTDKGRVFLGEG